MSYKGRVNKVSDTGAYGFIDIRSVTRDGEPAHDLPTQNDLFIHLDHFDTRIKPLRVGMEVVFESTHQDDKRGEGYLRTGFRVQESAQSKLDALSTGGIELIPQGQQGRLLEHSSIFFTWCISAQLAEKIKNAMVIEYGVRLLIIWWRNTDEWWRDRESEQRKLVKLTDPMTIISFDQSGVHHILAILVWGKDEVGLSDTYLSRTHNRYKTDVIGMGSVPRLVLESQTDPGIHWAGTGYMRVEIPTELFAHKPLDWEWVNWIFKSKPRDQCSYRWRRVFAYLVQPFIAPLWYITVFIVRCAQWLARCMFLLGLGVLGFGVLSFQSLNRFNSPDPWHWLTRDLETPRYLKRKTNMISGVNWSDRVAAQTARKQERLERRRRAVEMEVQEVLCDVTGRRPPNVWQLPVTVKTIRFYAAALKQKVCRPYAG